MHIFELRDRVMTLPALEGRLLILQKEIQKESEHVSVLLAQYKRESRDVERMQKESFSSFLLRLVGKYEDKLEKVQQEEINAKLVLDRAMTHLKGLKAEKDSLEKRVAALHLEAQAYQQELKNRRLKLAEVESSQYIALENERRNIITQITLIEEVQTTVAHTEATALSLLDSLESAQGWATFDVFMKTGIITHLAKYSHIDSAEEKFNKLSAQLQDLCVELSNITCLTIPVFSEISSCQRSIDFWFSNIFTSWSVREKIIDNADQIRDLLRNLNATSTALKLKLEEAEAAFEANKQHEEEFLLSVKGS